MPCSFDETDTAAAAAAAAMFICSVAAIVYNLGALFPALFFVFKAFSHFHHSSYIIRRLAHNGFNGKLVAVKTVKIFCFFKKQDVYKRMKNTFSVHTGLWETVINYQCYFLFNLCF